MQFPVIVLAVIVNCIMYLAFGSFFTVRKGRKWSFAVTMAVGFFAYYGLFALVCLPIMLTFRPLSLLTRIWAFVVLAIVLLSIFLFAARWLEMGMSIIDTIKSHPFITLIVTVVIVLQVVMVVFTYNFTLDAAYYVANVSTCVETDMINVYDPFTGAWQDHFELRYAFATYHIQDAVVCQLTGIPALIQTKTIMSTIVVILTNILYLGIAKFLSKDNRKMFAPIFAGMFFVNVMFVTIYTPANFLFSRTYEGKAIVGNIAVMAIFYMFVRRTGYFLTKKRNIRYGLKTSSNEVAEEVGKGNPEEVDRALEKDVEITDKNFWISMFFIMFGAATTSSTANMLLPAALSIMFIPQFIIHKDFKSIPRFILCMLPEFIMIIMYVLYVKGFYAIYTYPMY